jgi:hypothetical protein
MSDDVQPPPYVYEGLDPAPEAKSGLAEATEAVKNAAGYVGDAIEKGRKAIDEGRKPGMPLSILSNIAREAPLGSLLIAFLLGVAVARRR